MMLLESMQIQGKKDTMSADIAKRLMELMRTFSLLDDAPPQLHGITFFLWGFGQ
jgi:hypothetical protein